MLLYLDNCCFNRPYDDQSHAKIFLETQAKLYIQQAILADKYQLVWSYIFQFENEQNPYINHKQEIKKWKNLASHLVSASDEIIINASYYQSLGLRVKDALHCACKDALHCACAVSVNADYLITTDKQLINVAQKIAELKVINPLNFIQEDSIYENR